MDFDTRLLNNKEGKGFKDDFFRLLLAGKGRREGGVIRDCLEDVFNWKSSIFWCKFGTFLQNSF